MSQSIQVSFVQEGDVYTVHTGSSVLKDIVMDYTGVPETERGGNSSTLLIAAALSCFCGSIRAALVFGAGATAVSAVLAAVESPGRVDEAPPPATAYPVLVRLQGRKPA